MRLRRAAVDPGEYRNLVEAAEREHRVEQIGYAVGCGLPLLASVGIWFATNGALRLGLICGAWLVIPVVIYYFTLKSKAFTTLQKVSYQMVRKGVIGEQEIECMRIRIESVMRGFREGPGRKFVLKMMDKMEPKAREVFKSEWDEPTTRMMNGNSWK